MKRGSTFVTLDLFETAKVVAALGVQIEQLDAGLRCGAFARAKRAEVRCWVNGLVALRDRLNRRCAPAIDKLREDARGVSAEMSDNASSRSEEAAKRVANGEQVRFPNPREPLGRTAEERRARRGQADAR